MLRACLPGLLCAFVSSGTLAQDAAALRARHADLEAKLAADPFGRSLHVESSASGAQQKGEVFAVIARPFSAVGGALGRPADWCAILELQMNIKRCEPSAEGVSAYITRKPRDPPENAHQVDFRFERAAASADYLRVRLNAPSGPMGTRDFELSLEAASLEGGRTFFHMAYSYVLGTFARFAMDAYLAGAGRDKFGFTVVDRTPDGRPVYVDGARGVVERSAMRYYLGIEAHLESLAAAPDKRLETRLRRWYSATTRYPQLREVVSADEYLQIKLSELRAPLGLVDARR